MTVNSKYAFPSNFVRIFNCQKSRFSIPTIKPRSNQRANGKPKCYTKSLHNNATSPREEYHVHYNLRSRRGERKKNGTGLISRLLFLCASVIVMSTFCSLFTDNGNGQQHLHMLPRDATWISGQMVKTEPRGGHIDMNVGLDEILKQTIGAINQRLATVKENDPSFALIDQGWSGLIIGGDDRQPEKLNARFPNFPSNHIVKGVVSNIQADNIVELLKRCEFHENVAMLKIDIDSFDCHVMKSILEAGIRPQVIVMKTNEKFPPHVRFAMTPGYEEANDGSGSLVQIPFDTEKRGHIYGGSLGYQVHDTMHPAGYEIHYLDWNNVMYVDTLGMSPKKKALEDMYTDVNEWYTYCYWNRSDRNESFRANRKIKHWNSMETDALMEELQRKIMPLPSHANHHINWKNGDHYCFDSKGNLHLASSDDAKNCSKRIT